MSTNFKLNMVSPCHKNWDKMSVTQKGRYCNACKKEVLDLTNVDDKDLPTYLAGVTNFCGRIQPHRLNSITNTHKRFSFKKIAASVIMGLGLTALFPKYSNAQIIDAANLSADSLKKIGIEESECSQDKSTVSIKGRVRDKLTNQGISYGMVTFSSNGDIIGGAITDIDGNFKITSFANDDILINIEIKYYNYKLLTIKNIKLKNNNLYIALGLQANNILDSITRNDYEIGVVGGICVQFEKKSTDISPGLQELPDGSFGEIITKEQLQQMALPK